jgi:hypothetical protein
VLYSGGEQVRAVWEVEIEQKFEKHSGEHYTETFIGSTDLRFALNKRFSYWMEETLHGNICTGVRVTRATLVATLT